MTVNAQITGTMLGWESHGILTAYVHLSGDGWATSFGGLAFDQWNSAAGKREPHAFGMAFIASVLETVGVNSWEKLKGAHVRVDTAEVGRQILRIGHITKDRWFDPKALAAQYQAEEEA